MWSTKFRSIKSEIGMLNRKGRHILEQLMVKRSTQLSKSSCSQPFVKIKKVYALMTLMKSTMIDFKAFRAFILNHGNVNH